MSDAYLEIDQLSKQYGDSTAVESLSLTVSQGKMVALLGPSGCGKTTALRMLAGFITPSAGEIRIDGVSIADLPPYRRMMGMVFQSYALFPHMTVAQNIGFGLEMQRRPAAEIASITGQMQALVKLPEHGERYPRELSGGQQQRVALARALAPSPRLLLLDEPLSNLDASLRQEVAREIRLLQQASGIATIMVTHDQDEAMAMADVLVVMRAGRVQQIGTQRELYETPANPFVASFIGGSNLLDGQLVEGKALRLSNGDHIALAGRYDAAGAAVLAVRPENIVIRSAGEAAAPVDGAVVAGTVELATYLGHVVEYVVKIAPELRIIVRTTVSSRTASQVFSPNDAVVLGWDRLDERVFDAEGKASMDKTSNESSKG